MRREACGGRYLEREKESMQWDENTVVLVQIIV
jgi:hypothetical protein